PPAGVLFGALLTLYGTARYMVEFVRYIEPEQYFFQGTSHAMTNNQLICLGFIAFGLYRIIVAYMKKEKHADQG
ncbi:MAG: hypothetical protein U9P14_02265, partial [Gemmatimonadota bacterium]|nr:hypothetical protein [Gemmatimonadota bacterium]